MDKRPETHLYIYSHTHTQNHRKTGTILSSIDVVFVYKTKPSFKIWMIRSTCQTGRKSLQYTLYNAYLKEGEGIKYIVDDYNKVT